MIRRAIARCKSSEGRRQRTPLRGDLERREDDKAKRFLGHIRGESGIFVGGEECGCGGAFEDTL